MARLAALAGALTISFSPIFVRLAGVSPDTSAFFRALYALPALALLWLALGRRLRSRRLAALALASGLLLGLDLAFWHRSIEWIGAGLAVVLGNTQVIFVGVAAWLLHGERPGWQTLVAVPLAFAGITLVSGLGRADAYGENPLLGTFFGLLTGITYAGFLLVFRRASRDETTPYGAFFLCTLGTVATTGAVGAATGGLELGWSWPAHGWLLALAHGSQVFGWLLIAYALPRLPAVQTSLLLLLQPIASVTWAYLLFTEILSPVQWAGVVLVLSGIALPTATRAPRAGPIVRRG